MTEQQAEKTVLIVEDDAGIGYLLVQFLEQETPYAAQLVTTGNEALHILRRSRPSLLLVDYHLPGMTGIELYDQLQHVEGGIAIPIILMSATLPHREIAHRQMIAIQKPFDIDDLLRTIHRLLD